MVFKPSLLCCWYNTCSGLHQPGASRSPTHRFDLLELAFSNFKPSPYLPLFLLFSALAPINIATCSFTYLFTDCFPASPPPPLDYKLNKA